MGHRLSRITTRTGDSGTTGLGDGSRVAKDDARIEALGVVDELNCLIGSLLATPALPATAARVLLRVQHDLFDLGGELSIPGSRTMSPRHISALEEDIESFNATLPPLKEFILPGGGEAASRCHLARAVARRAERRCWTLARVEEAAMGESLIYLNRLSDLLFVLARVLARHERGSEILWDRSRID
ncbi:MAG: cob(I)yrinic acid a,c-diamide adenosyltransferase [Nevskiaceae bacterium]|jgi:cob(I)alamin adenosyltransferase|nr:cob(I)yrinic acid a,c-diamide adenosyltransferase [Nevskiaceae bacterium]